MVVNDFVTNLLYIQWNKLCNPTKTKCQRRNIFPRRNYVICNSTIIGGKNKRIEVEI